MLAPCGLICTDCDIYKAAHDPVAAERLAQQWRDGGNTKVTADWFKCLGCDGPDELVWSGDCKIRQCCRKERRLANCSECDAFPCDLITKFENDGYAHHRKAVENLRRMIQERVTPEQQLSRLAGRCGIYCGECPFRKEGKCPGCVPAAGKIFWGECELAKCCVGKGLDHCGLCAEFPCAKLKSYSYDAEHGDNGARIRNLEAWRKIGLAKWLETQGRNGPL